MLLRRPCKSSPNIPVAVWMVMLALKSKSTLMMTTAESVADLVMLSTETSWTWSEASELANKTVTLKEIVKLSSKLGED